MDRPGSPPDFMNGDSAGETIYRARSNTWPSVDLENSLNNATNFSHQSLESPRLVSITESNESAPINEQVSPDSSTPLQSSEIQIAPTIFNKPGKIQAAHPSYVELITMAINSTVEKRMTLSEIYDWISSNVPAFRDQRNIHSSSGWKNSVRHNLSLQRRFKRVKRNGMDKPSWWTVDLNDQLQPPAKERRRNSLNAATSDAKAAATASKSVAHRRRGSDASTLISLLGAKKRSGGERKKSREMTSPSSSTLPINSPASYERETSVKPDSAFASRTSLDDSAYMDLSTTKRSSFQNDSETTVSNTVKDQHEQQIQTILVTLREKPSTDTFSNFNNIVGGVSNELCCSSQPKNATLFGGSDRTKPQISLQVKLTEKVQSKRLSSASESGAAECDADSATSAAKSPGVATVLNKYLKPSSARESRQMLRVSTDFGGVHDVAVPAPLPIRVVVQDDKEVQTETCFLESQLRHLLTISGSVEPCDNRKSLFHSNSSDVEPSSSPTFRIGNLDRKPGFSSPMWFQQTSENVFDLSSSPKNVHQQQILLPNIESLQRGNNNPMFGGAANQLPEDLANVEVEGDVDCNILDILSYEMACDDRNHPK